MRRPRIAAPVSALIVGLLGAWGAPAGAQVRATMKLNDSRTQGTHESGRLLLYTPRPVEEGSSISHWDTSARPNLLMEPFSTGDLRYLRLDLTKNLMKDIFWRSGKLKINVTDSSPAGTGFADPTPFVGAPGNPAPTLGEARTNLFNAVLGAWANTLRSPVEVDVVVSWEPLACDENLGATLGAATTTVIIGLEGGGLPETTFFPAALAEALLEEDLTGPPAEGGGDILIFMNSDIDKECLGSGTGFYYGLDGKSPSGLFAAWETLLHELAHGLGFANFTNERTGARLGGGPSIYDLFTYDEVKGKYWDQLRKKQRVRSAVNFRQVTWAGPSANARAARILKKGVVELEVHSPASLAGTYAVELAQFGPRPPRSDGLTADLACMRDAATDGSAFNGCSAATQPEEVAGKIALVDRGECEFVVKVANAQAAGAVGVVVANNEGPPFAMGGSDASLVIPSLMVGKTDGKRLHKVACKG